MKKLLLFSFVSISLTAYSQQVLTGLGAEKLIPAAKQIMFNSRTSAPAFIQFKPGAEVQYDQFSNWAKTNLNLRSSDNFALVRTEKDRLGHVHYRLQQTFNAIPVEWATYIVHTKNNKIVSMNGDFNQGIIPENILVLSETASLSKALKSLAIRKLMIETPGFQEQLRKDLNDNTIDISPKGQLVVLPIGDGVSRVFKYAYKFDIFAAEPYGRWNVYVDAGDGSILGTYTLIHTDKAQGIAKTKYSGDRTITTDSITEVGPNLGKFRLLDANHNTNSGVAIETKNAKNVSTGAAPSTAVDFIDDDNYWNNVNANYDEAATDAHWGAANTYDFYLENFDRNSYNDKGGKLLSFVHVEAKSYYNASWNGYYMIYGDGGGKPLTSIDICGHELTHGVTGNSAQLLYQRESGGLNESFSDIFGNTIEYRVKPDKFNWKVGQDLGTPLRNMENPNEYGDPDTYKGKNWKDASPACTPNSNTNDLCGVHSNSGVQNYWYYLLVKGGKGTNDKNENFEVKGVGFDTASRVAYRNLTTYLTAQSDYLDAAFYGRLCAVDLYGDTSQAFISTVNAWHAVGLGKAYSVIPVSDFSVAKRVCQTYSDIEFVNNSGSATEFIWNFGDGTPTSGAANPKHEYQNAGKYDVTLIAKSSTGVDTLVKKQFIEIYDQELSLSACENKCSNPQSTLGPLQVSLGTIDNTSKGAVEGQYFDYTCLRTVFRPENTYPISILTNASTVTYTRVWIDYNNDATFTAEELAFKTDSNVQFHNGKITIPNTAVRNTPLRVRVVSAKPLGNTPDDPCSIVKYGQIEEYAVYVDENGPVGVENNLASTIGINVFPNPNTGSLTIQLANTNNAVIAVSIVNTLGETVYTENVQVNGSLTKSIDLSTLAKGIYIVKASSGTSQQLQKLILQ